MSIFIKWDPQVAGFCMPVIGTEVHSMHPSLNLFKNNSHIYGHLF